MSDAVHGTYTGVADGKARKKRFYVKDGSNHYRILPPFGTLAKDGAIAKYWEVYWLTGSKGKRPVVSLLKKDKNKNIIVNDPIHDKVTQLNKSIEAMEKSGQPKAIVDALKETVKGLNIDKAFYLNAMSPSGEIGVLKIKYTAFQALKTRLEELKQMSIDPINVGPDKGVFFDFKKSKDDKGKVVYSVDIATKTTKNPNGPGFITEIQMAPIDEMVLKRMENEAFDLLTLYTVRTQEEHAALANLDPKTVDAIFSRAEEVDEDESSFTEEDVSQALASTVNLTTQSTPTPAQAAPQAATPQEMEDIVKRFLEKGTL